LIDRFGEDRQGGGVELLLLSLLQLLGGHFRPGLARHLGRWVSNSERRKWMKRFPTEGF
jgi:hypothetical protein